MACTNSKEKAVAQSQIYFILWDEAARYFSFQRKRSGTIHMRK